MVINDLAAVIEDDVASLVNFNNIIELGIDDQVDSFLQWSGKVHVQSQVATLHQIEVSARRQVWTQIERKQCVPCGVVITSDGVALVLVHFIRTGEKGLVGSDIIFEIEGVLTILAVERFVGHEPNHDTIRELSQRHVVLSEGQIAAWYRYHLAQITLDGIFGRAFLQCLHVSQHDG